MPGSAQLEPIADARLVDQIARPSRVRLELVAELPHVHAQVLCLLHVGRAPDFLQELTVCDDLAGET